MEKKMMGWKTRGMNKDLSVSAFNPEFSFENMNLRLSTNEGNTLMSWVNEKGTTELNSYVENSSGAPSSTALVISGYPVGTAILNDYLVIFTTTNTNPNSSGTDRIYRFRNIGLDNGSYKIAGKKIFDGNLNLCTLYPLETLVSYEAEHIQKVYWVDGRNQPRVINIVSEKTFTNTSFDFVPVANFPNVTVTKNVSGGGLFAPGVIQYAISYYNKFGQQSNVVWVSPLEYLAFADRGASPEEKVSCSFKIDIDHLSNYSFDYVRIYSIQRTSLNLDPIVKIVVDLPVVSTESTVYIDNGTTGAIIDPYELLFIGGKEITALTMADKDGTLFLGNVQEKGGDSEDIFEYFYKHSAISNATFGVATGAGTIKNITLDSTTGVYSNTNMLNFGAEEITTFKGGDTYRLGFQLQKETGEWTEPIYLGDKANTVYPSTTIGNSVKLPYITAQLNTSGTSGDDSYSFSGYKKIRPLIVYPSMSDRTVVCQGVLNPTVFNAVDRKTNSPFAQASWYFRPYTSGDEKVGTNVTVGTISTTRTALAPDTVVALDPDISTNSLKEVYVFVCSISSSAALDTILSNGYLNAKRHYGSARSGTSTGFGSGRYENRNSSDRTHSVTYSFLGVIAMNITGVGTRYAFISENRLDAPFGDITNAEEDSLIYTDAITDISASRDSFKFYNGMQINATRHFYFPKMGNSTASYTFSFYDTQYLYAVTFPYVDNTRENFTITGGTTGSRLRFNHYDSLFSRSELSGSKDDKLESAKQIEIQGSAKLYANPFSSSPIVDVTNSLGQFGGSRYKIGDAYTTNRNPFTNTQFFIDQSIVTLNSPDIEFDTDVQNHPMEDLSVYIIGAIPITASASAHHITTSSNMLDTYHNKEEDAPTSEYTNGSFGGSGIKHHYFGNGELPINVLYKNKTSASNTSHLHLVSEYLWNDVLVSNDTSYDDKITTSQMPYDFLIHPWQRTGPLNNDQRTKDVASSWLRTKKESNLLYSVNTEYFTGSTLHYDTNAQIILTENDEVMNYRLPKQGSTTSEINYYPNIDKVLFNENGYETLLRTNEDTDVKVDAVTSPISMKYKSTSHAVLALKASSGDTINILPRAGSVGYYNPASPTPASGTTFWGDTVAFSQENKGTSFNSYGYSFLWLGELRRNTVSNRFGGTSKSAIRANKWLVGGEAVDLYNGSTLKSSVTLTWTYGDTYYQRYDCLKTYPFSREDTNQMVEILSFMCETHVNIDGRYDRNRGQIDNTNMSPVNFNLLNPVYSQQDNFFTYRKLDSEQAGGRIYPNQVVYSKSKNSTSDVDPWTNITMANTLELDGDKGKLNKLTRFNDQLLAFQDTGISQILYNENVAISSQQGVPIEIANSGKVTGKRYLSDTIGCSNKWAMTNTPSGIYFMDNHDKGIYLFNGQLRNLSTELGFNSWCKQHIPNAGMSWNPVDFGNASTGNSAFMACYDKLNQDVLFVNKDTALAFSEKLGSFTSFYDYGGTPWLCNLGDYGIWVAKNSSNTKLWLHQKGNYGRFFGVNKPYWMTLVGNPEPLRDKMFTNMEFRACVEGEGTPPDGGGTGAFSFDLPFDYLECWDEYQHGYAKLENKNGHSAMVHYADNTSALKRKFRMWRCDVPRDNCVLDANRTAGLPYSTDSDLGISRYSQKPMNRLRNPWIYLKLKKDTPDESGGTVAMKKVEVHDMGMWYFV